MVWSCVEHRRIAPPHHRSSGKYSGQAKLNSIRAQDAAQAQEHRHGRSRNAPATEAHN